MDQHTCAQCAALFDREPEAKGQKASWCTGCRRRYMRDYQRAHYVPRPERPPKPEPITPTCRICGINCPPRHRALCGSDECRIENGRRIARSRRREKPDSFLIARELGWRKRRARRRSAHSEPYVAAEIAERDGWRCHLCGKKIPPSGKSPDPRSLSIDHVVPLASGGDDTPANVKVAHRLCNSIKGDRAHPRGEQLLLVG